MAEQSFAAAVAHNAPLAERKARWAVCEAEITAVLEGEDDWIAAMASVSCALRAAWSSWHWVGFYRVVSEDWLIVGPYQGSLGCLRIPMGQGVCGVAAATRTTQRVSDVREVAHHIACASSTLSEIVVPVCDAHGDVIAVIDVDSDVLHAFDELDAQALEGLARRLSKQFFGGR